jgi:hypothetical protein
MFQLLALNMTITAQGGASVVLRAAELVKGLQKEFGSLEAAEAAINRLEEPKKGLAE